MTQFYRQRVVRADGRTINVVQRRAHLSYCQTGCCCGRTDRGYAAAPVETYKDEWLRRKLRNQVHLTKAGCLGPCALANIASLVFLDKTQVLRLMRAKIHSATLTTYPGTPKGMPYVRLQGARRPLFVLFARRAPL